MRRLAVIPVVLRRVQLLMAAPVSRKKRRNFTKRMTLITRCGLFLPGLHNFPIPPGTLLILRRMPLLLPLLFSASPSSFSSSSSSSSVFSVSDDSDSSAVFDRSSLDLMPPPPSPLSVSSSVMTRNSIFSSSASSSSACQSESQSSAAGAMAVVSASAVTSLGVASPATSCSSPLSVGAVNLALWESLSVFELIHRTGLKSPPMLFQFVIPEKQVCVFFFLSTSMTIDISILPCPGAYRIIRIGLISCCGFHNRAVLRKRQASFAGVRRKNRKWRFRS